MRKLFLVLTLSVLVGLLAACGGTVSASTVVQSPGTPAGDSRLVVEGKLQPVQSVELSFGVSGEVAEVRIKAGDSVKAGDVIARLQTDSLEAAAAQAEAGLAVAQANAALLPQQIADAQAQVRAAQAQLAGASVQRDDSAELISAQAALAQALYDQQQAQTAYDQLSDRKVGGTREEQARLALSTAIQNARAAQVRVDQLQSGSPIDRAQSAQVAAASASLQAAQAQLDRLQAEADGQTVGSAAAAVQQAQAALQAARTNLAQAELRAPFSGTIAQIDLKVGERVAPGTIVVRLADFSGWEVQTDDLTELKVPSVSVGRPANVTFDALPELELKGEVESIDAVPQEQNGDVTYPVTVRLLTNDPQLRWGMTAAVTFEP
jgi:HlyD family secretion protein